MFLHSVQAQNIVVERYEKWHHPILAVFKKYGLTLYKISYSKDGKCPRFYAKFKYATAEMGSLGAEFHKLYFAAFEANSESPYILVNKEDNELISVGWDDKEKRIFSVDMKDISSKIHCKTGIKTNNTVKTVSNSLLKDLEDEVIEEK